MAFFNKLMGCILIHFHSSVKAGMACLKFLLWSKTVYSFFCYYSSLVVLKANTIYFTSVVLSPHIMMRHSFFYISIYIVLVENCFVPMLTTLELRCAICPHTCTFVYSRRLVCTGKICPLIIGRMKMIHVPTPTQKHTKHQIVVQSNKLVVNQTLSWPRNHCCTQNKETPSLIK